MARPRSWRRRLAGLAAATALLLPAAAGAQSWRTAEIRRPLADSAAHQVRVPLFGARIGVRPTGGSTLFHSQLRYDAAAARPVYAYDPASRTLRIGAQESASRSGERGSRAGELRLDLSREVPLDLAFDLTGVRGDLDLTGLRLSRLRLESAASDLTIRFDTLNAVPLGILELDLDAAGVRVQQLANANAREVRVHTRLGDADLDFGGRWTQNVELRVDVLFGDVTIHVPADIGVRVEVDKVIAAFRHDGLAQRGQAYESENWEDARFKLHIRAETTLSKLEIDRTGR